jgi:hypothetical protein
MFINPQARTGTDSENTYDGSSSGVARRMTVAGGRRLKSRDPARLSATGAATDLFAAVQRLILEIFVPSMLTPAIKPCWSKMKA